MQRAMLRQLLLWICVISMAKVFHAFKDDEGLLILNPNYDACNTTDCLKIDKIFKDIIKDENDPCVDFFKYACGGTLINQVGGEMKKRFPAFEELLNDDVPYDQSEAYKLDTKLHEQCRKRDKQTDIKAFREIMKRFGAEKSREILQTSVSIPAHVNKNTWKEVDLSYASAGFGFAFFEVDVVEWETNEAHSQNENTRKKERYIQISATRDNIMQINRYFDKQHAMDGCNTPSCESLSSFLDDFNKLPKHNNSQESMRIAPMRITDWTTEFQQNNNEFNSYWHDVFKAFFDGLLLPVPLTKYVIVKDEQYFLELAKFLASRQTSDVIEHYIHLRFRSKLEYIRKENYHIENAPIPRIEGVKCGTGFFVGAAYRFLDNYFRINDTDELKRIFDDVTERLEKLLGEYPAVLTPYTMEFLDKLKKAKKVFGYPRWLADENFIKHFYDDMELPSRTYLDSQIAILKKATKIKFKALIDPKHPIIDYRELSEAYAYDKMEFIDSLSRIVIPLKTFAKNTFKYYSYLLFPTMNFASAGTNIAYEIFLKWLSGNQFMQSHVTKCLADQMHSSYQASDSDMLQQKSTAYALALRASFESWRKLNSYPIQFKEFGAISDLEVFFLTFAQSLCFSTPFEGNDSPGMFINLAVSNFDEFSDTYACISTKDKDKYAMNRENKCDPLDIVSSIPSPNPLNVTVAHITSE